MRKKLVELCLFFITLLLFAKGNTEKDLVFGATYMTMNNPFFVSLNDGIKGIVEAKGDKLISYDPALDLTKQLEQIYSLIAQKVDVIILNPVDYKGIRPALVAAKKAGIPIINVDSAVFDTDLVDCIVESDNCEAGRLIAIDLQKRLNCGKIAILEHPTVKAAIDRIQAFEDTLSQNSSFEIAARGQSNGQIEIAMPAMEKILKEQPEINIVIALNDPTAMGALAALESTGAASNVLIYGIDGSPDAKKMVYEKRITATVAQSPIRIGREAATAAYAILAGENIQKEILVPVVLIDSTNIREYNIESWQ